MCHNEKNGIETTTSQSTTEKLNASDDQSTASTKTKLDIELIEEDSEESAPSNLKKKYFDLTYNVNTSSNSANFENRYYRNQQTTNKTITHKIFISLHQILI